MEVGLNSYVSVAYADEYVNLYYADEPTAEKWSALTEVRKEGLLLTACRDLDTLPFSGEANADQPLTFPRIGQIDVPTQIEFAQVEIALLPLRQTEMSQNEASRRAALQAQGVKSFSLGDLSESYEVLSGSIAQKHAFMADQRIAGLLERYLGGSFDTC